MNGKETRLYTLKGANGIVAQVTNFGARIVKLFVPDDAGGMANVVLGFNSLSEYQRAGERFYGCTVGRYANRIANGRFTLDGKEYVLATNDGDHHLHGGINGFDRVVWDVADVTENSIELVYTARHMEEGYPGTLFVRVTYTLTDDNALGVRFRATTDAPTIVNTTHHSFFNLGGAGSGTINDHLLQIHADSYTPVDQGLIPTGRIAPVENTPMDFREPVSIGERVDAEFDQLKYGRGYDHNWVVGSADSARVVARVIDPESGRVLEIVSDQPGLQFYGGNFFNGSDVGSSGEAHRFREAFALEPQFYPDSPNHPEFPSTVLRPDEIYSSYMAYRFGLQ